MAAIDDVELNEDATNGIRTIKIKNTTTDSTLAATVRIGGACQEVFFAVVLRPLKEARVARERAGDAVCRYEIDSAKYFFY